MSTQSIYSIFDEDLEDKIDSYMVCSVKEYIRRNKYNLGGGSASKRKEENAETVKKMRMIDRMRHIAFNDTYALSENERNIIKERLNRLVAV